MILAIILAGLSQITPQPVNIPIKNPSFEDSVPAQYQRSCGSYTYEIPPGWTSSTGVVAVLVPVNPRTCDFSNPPDGKQMVVIQNGTLSQNLGDVSKMIFADQNGGVNGVYMAHFFVSNYFYWYPGKYAASLSLFCQPGNTLCTQGTTQVLCKTSGWGMGDFQEITLVCPSQRKYGELILTLASGSATGEPYGNGYENLFDNVSLTFTPSN